MKSLLTSFLVLAALPAMALAQSTDTYAVHQGSGEFTISANGASDRNFDNNVGGASLSVGKYFSPTLLGVFRQSVFFNNPSGPGSDLNGSSKIALDAVFGPNARVRPFLGGNFGGFYGDNTNDTWAAGLEAGVKFYRADRTFIYAMGEYGWAFKHAHGVTNNFDDGQWNWSVGVGFNY